MIFYSLSRDIDPLMRRDLFDNELIFLKKFSEILLVINYLNLEFIKRNRKQRTDIRKNSFN